MVRKCLPIFVSTFCAQQTTTNIHASNNIYLLFHDIWRSEDWQEFFGFPLNLKKPRSHWLSSKSNFCLPKASKSKDESWIESIEFNS
jgi:hypothetical protein